MITKRIALSAAPLLFAAAFMSPALALAATTLTANETVANVSAGNTDQTAVTTPTQANVAQIKATRTLTVNSLPAASTTSTVGSCVITYSTSTADDLNCSGGAVINVTTHNASSTLASTLGSLTGVTDAVNGHGALTATSSGFTATFTTTGSEASTTAVYFVDGTSGAVSNTSSTNGQLPVAQINTVTIGGTPETGDTYTVTLPTVGAVSYTVLSGATTTSLIANALKTAVLASAGYGSQAFTAATSTNTVIFTAKAAGTGFTQTSSTTNYPGVAQTVTFTPAGIAPDINYIVTINNADYHYVQASDDAISDVTAGLNAALASASAVSCSEDGTKVTCASSTPGTTFTYSATTETYVKHTSHGGGGGGSSHASSESSSTSAAASDTASLEAQVAKLQAQLAALLGTNTSKGFTRDLDVGATGADVMSLQVWLNGHGFPVATSGVGSMSHETSTFGGLTKAALAKFQASVGISPAAGFFGPKTRAYIEAH